MIGEFEDKMSGSGYKNEYKILNFFLHVNDRELQECWGDNMRMRMVIFFRKHSFKQNR